MSESLLQVIKLPLEVYYYFELDIEQDEKCTASLIKQETEWIEWFYSFLQKVSSAGHKFPTFLFHP